jgi:predicted glycogen debranching enzyme
MSRITAFSNGIYTHQPDWYRNFLYKEEQARGLDHTEDLATPGSFGWNLSEDEAVLIFSTGEQKSSPLALIDVPAHAYLHKARAAERQRRQRFSSRLQRAADAYVVRRGEGKTIVAGYPWFTDWGRDTFIALRGLCLATGRLDEAREILLAWADTVSEGMLPNRFPDHGDGPEFNSVDASLWYVIAVHDFFQTVAASRRTVSPPDQQTLHDAIEAILSGYEKGTRYHIHADSDGLLAAGEPGAQLTWMDAKIGDWVVTPRIGKPVEVEALWLNALHIASTFSAHWRDLFTRGREAFQSRFWNDSGGYLYDIVDPDHRAGSVDAAFRPNQILAVGGLPISLLDPDRACRVVEAVEARLWTPLGLRSLAPEQPGYVPQYQGGVRERDSAYHQGTVWPWLIGPFVEAWVRVHGGTPEAKRAARAQYLEPLLRHLDEAGLGHISEIADGAPPHTPHGCPFQAWSVGEVLRLSLVVLAEDM